MTWAHVALICVNCRAKFVQRLCICVFYGWCRAKLSKLWIDLLSRNYKRTTMVKGRKPHTSQIMHDEYDQLLSMLRDMEASNGKTQHCRGIACFIGSWLSFVKWSGSSWIHAAIGESPSRSVHRSTWQGHWQVLFHVKQNKCGLASHEYVDFSMRCFRRPHLAVVSKICINLFLHTKRTCFLAGESFSSLNLERINSAPEMLDFGVHSPTSLHESVDAETHGTLGNAHYSANEHSYQDGEDKPPTNNPMCH